MGEQSQQERELKFVPDVKAQGSDYQRVSLRGDEASRLLCEADEAFAAEGVRDPARFCASTSLTPCPSPPARRVCGP